MILQKWNPKKHIYEPFDSPAKNITLICTDMQQKVDCVNCGKEIEFGKSYTSRMIHTQVGLGYPVCKDCHNIELQQNIS